MEPDEKVRVNPFLSGPAKEAIQVSGSGFSRDGEGRCCFTLSVYEGKPCQIEGRGANEVEAAINFLKERDELRASARQGII
ncbi:MAG: hypothetical protein WC793_02480 [Candidatus Paceibacterota bacterium]|jgi:hypothetical protein